MYIFTDLVFKHFILHYCTYSLIKMHNMDHTISECPLLYGRFQLYNSSFLTYDACTMLGLCFQFWKTSTFFKNVGNMWKKTSSFKHAAWSTDSILCFWRDLCLLHFIGRRAARNCCAIQFIDRTVARTCCTVHVLTSRISLTWHWWIRQW